MHRYEIIYRDISDFVVKREELDRGSDEYAEALARHTVDTMGGRRSYTVSRIDEFSGQRTYVTSGKNF